MCLPCYESLLGQCTAVLSIQHSVAMRKRQTEFLGLLWAHRSAWSLIAMGLCRLGWN